MSSKIDGVPRHLIESAANYMEGSASTQVVLWCRELRETLAAPVVERQPVGQIRNDIERANCLWFGTLPPHGTNLYTAPPELAELQATIARLTAENERLKKELSHE